MFDNNINDINNKNLYFSMVVQSNKGFGFHIQPSDIREVLQSKAVQSQSQEKAQEPFQLTKGCFAVTSFKSA